MASDILPKSSTRKKVILKPGFSLMDWINLTNSARDIAGLKGKRPGPLKWEEIWEHNSVHDAWTVYQGKVYNITPYMHYHPGGIPILKSVAGRDCTSEFNKYHQWVNVESMIGKTLVGFVTEPEPKRKRVISDSEDDESENEEKEESEKNDKKDVDIKEDNGSSSSNAKDVEIGNDMLPPPPRIVNSKINQLPSESTTVQQQSADSNSNQSSSFIANETPK